MYKEWNEIIKQLSETRPMYEVFDDLLDWLIDQFTEPDHEPRFNHTKYTGQEIILFPELMRIFIRETAKTLEKSPYSDFLGTWWEKDQKKTNKNKFFTSHDVVRLTESLLGESSNKESYFYDCCCGTGRFLLQHHAEHLEDVLYGEDNDLFVIKIALVNMAVHGCKGILVRGNTLTKEVYEAWTILPQNKIGGVGCIVPVGTNLQLAGDLIKFS